MKTWKEQGCGLGNGLKVWMMTVAQKDRQVGSGFRISYRKKRGKWRVVNPLVLAEQSDSECTSR